MSTNRKEEYTIAVAIATHNRKQLLQRTLESIAQEKLPVCFKGVWVVENGEKCGVRAICESFSKMIPIIYAYEKNALKAAALNRIMSNINVDFIVFTDDDVRFSGRTLAAYDDVINKYGKGHFFGGPVLPDYERRPDPRFAPFLPASVRGFKLFVKDNKKDFIITPQIFLGANWGAFTEDIKFNTGFNVLIQEREMWGHVETEMEEKLIKAGCDSVYIVDALVYHYVPKGRCSFKWLTLRKYRQHHVLGKQKALDRASRNKAVILFGCPRWMIRMLMETIFAIIGDYIFFKSDKKKIKDILDYYKYKGFIHGFRKGFLKGK